MPSRGKRLAGRGIMPWSIDRGFMDDRTGQLLQCDVTFVRRSLLDDR